MEKIKRCKDCGGKVSRKIVDLGYISAQELGRPSGAKGRDEWTCYLQCESCGSLDWLESNASCFLCGAEPTEWVDLWARNYKVTGLRDFVPGWPTHCNICDQCGDKLDAEITRLVQQAFDEGGFE